MIFKCFGDLLMIGKHATPSLLMLTAYVSCCATCASKIESPCMTRPPANPRGTNCRKFNLSPLASLQAA